MEDQVLDWLYEQCIKRDYYQLCSGIEAEFKKRGRQPEIPKSGFLFFVRRLQIILHEDKIITKTNLGALANLLQDILQYDPFQNCLNFHQTAFRLLMIVKLWLVDEETLHHETLQKHLPYFSEDSLKFCYEYQDDHYKEYYTKLISAAHEAIEASASEQTTHLNPGVREAMERILEVDLPKLKDVLMMLIPATAIEKLINNEELRETFATQGGPEFKILLTFIKKDITESVVREVIQELLSRAQSLIPEHATISEESRTLSELETAEDVNLSKEKLDFEELQQIKCTTCKEADGDQRELVLVNGRMIYMKKSPEVPVKLFRVGRLEKKRKFSATHTNTDGLCDTELNDKQMPVSHEEHFILIHNSKKIKVVSKEVPALVQWPSKSRKHQKTSRTRKSNLTESCMENADIQKLEEMLTKMEHFLSLLKAKLKQEKEKRAAAGLQRFGDERGNSGDEDRDHLDLSHEGTDLATLSTVQQLTHHNSQVKDGHQASVITNKDQKTQDSQNFQNSASKILPSEKSLIAIMSDSHDFEEIRDSPSKPQDKSQRNKNSNNESASLSSPTFWQMSQYFPSQACMDDQNALSLQVGESSVISETSDFHLVQIVNKGSLDTSFYQQETVETFRNDKENKRPSQPPSPSQECEIPPNLNSESLLGATSQEYVDSRSKQGAVCEICEPTSPSKISRISSSGIKPIVDETPTNKGLLSPKQNMLQNSKELEEEIAEGEYLPLSHDSDDDACQTKTKSLPAISKELRKECDSHETTQSLSLKVEESEQELKLAVSPVSSVLAAASQQSDDEVFFTPTCNPGPKSSLFYSTPNDISDADSWISARNSVAPSQDTKAMKP